MGVKALNWVWEHSRSKNGPRLVLLAIADYAQDEGSAPWPAIATLARKANLSITATHAAIKSLVELGELEVDAGGGKRTPNGWTNGYRIVMRHYDEPRPLTHRNRGKPKPATGTDSEPLPNPTPSGNGAEIRTLYGAGFSTRADSAPLPIFDDGVPIPDPGGADSGPRTTNEPLEEPPVRAVPPPNGGAQKPGTAQTLVDEWMQHCAARPPRQVIGQVARALKQMVEDQVPYEAVREGLAVWHRKRLNPSALPSCVNEVLQGPREDDRFVAGSGNRAVAPVTSADQMVV